MTAFEPFETARQIMFWGDLPNGRKPGTIYEIARSESTNNIITSLRTD